MDDKALTSLFSLQKLEKIKIVFYEIYEDKGQEITEIKVASKNKQKEAKIM